MTNVPPQINREPTSQLAGEAVFVSETPEECL